MLHSGGQKVGRQQAMAPSRAQRAGSKRGAPRCAAAALSGSAPRRRAGTRHAPQRGWPGVRASGGVKQERNASGRLEAVAAGRADGHKLAPVQLPVPLALSGRAARMQMEPPEESGEARRVRLRAMRDAAAAPAAEPAPSRLGATLSNPLAEEDAARGGGDAARPAQPPGTTFYRCAAGVLLVWPPRGALRRSGCASASTTGARGAHASRLRAATRWRRMTAAQRRKLARSRSRSRSHRFSPLPSRPRRLCTRWRPLRRRACRGCCRRRRRRRAGRSPSFPCCSRMCRRSR